MVEREVSWGTTFHRLVEEKLKATDKAQYEAFSQMDSDKKEEFIRKHLSHLNPCEPQMLKDARAFFEPILDKCISKQVISEIVSLQPSMNSGIHNIDEFFVLMRKIESAHLSILLEEQTRMTLPYYLMMGEGAYAKYVNLTILMLVRGGTPFYRLKDGKKNVANKINNYNKIEKETLGSKLAFLDNEGHTYITKFYNRRLRNSVAHMSFIVFIDGSVGYWNLGETTPSYITNQELVDQVQELINFCNCAWETLQQIMADWVKANQITKL